MEIREGESYNEMPLGVDQCKMKTVLIQYYFILVYNRNVHVSFVDVTLSG